MKKLTMTLGQIEDRIQELQSEIDFLCGFTTSSREYTHIVPNQAMIHELEDMRDKRIEERDLLKRTKERFLQNALVEIPGLIDESELDATAMHKNNPVRYPVSEWARRKGYIIMDSDGFPKGINELVSEDEFEKGITLCTVRRVVNVE